MNLADVTSLANGPILELIQWLQRQNCIADPLRCTACNIQMVLTQRNGDHVDGYFWYVRSSQFVMHILSIEISYQFCFVWWGRMTDWLQKGCIFRHFQHIYWDGLLFFSSPSRREIKAAWSQVRYRNTHLLSVPIFFSGKLLYAIPLFNGHPY